MTFSERELDTYPAIYEQDVDLVIVMALRVSERVRKLFCEAARIESQRLMEVHHSVSTFGCREADIEARFGDPEHPFVLQIEDKIDARFTEEQPEAYAARAARIAASDDFGGAAAVLCAPERYLDSAIDELRNFHGSVSHESLRDALLEEGPWGRELALLVQHAILQHRRSSSIAPTDDRLTAQLRAFAAHAADVGLPVPKIGNRAGDTQIWLETSTLRSMNKIQALLRLVPDRGIVDIELYGLRRWLDVDAFRAAELEVNFRLSNRNLYIWLEPAGVGIDLTRSLDDLHVAIAEQWQCAARLRAWWDTTGAETVAKFVVEQ